MTWRAYTNLLHEIERARTALHEAFPELRARVRARALQGTGGSRCPMDTDGDGNCPRHPNGCEEEWGQWCMLHDMHQDDPVHPYEYPECERHLRDATPGEEVAR